MTASKLPETEVRSASGPLLFGLVLLGVCLRLLAMGLFPANMDQDLDAYLGIAQGLAAGHGYCSPGSETPTAYRPPLYPVLLASTYFAGRAGRMILHLVLASLMFRWQWRTARKLGLSKWACALATLLLALDPLLIWYGTFPMTEALCSALTAGMLFRLSQGEPKHWQNAAITGLVFGLCVLARPTYWIWGGLLAGCWLWSRVRHIARIQKVQPLPTTSVETRPQWQTAVALLAGIAVTIAPWGIRNWLVMGEPILMTTHGGYTLLLANNPSFYQHEVQQPWGTIWTGQEFDQWSQDLQAQIQANNLQHEIEIDRWEGVQARQFIREHPAEFLQATGHRIAMFWNIVPSGEVSHRVPQSALIAIGSGYALWWVLALVGTWQVVRQGNPRWKHILLLILAFTALHAIYWSNIRLRAPLMPAIALLAANAVSFRPGIKPS